VLRQVRRLARGAVHRVELATFRDYRMRKSICGETLHLRIDSLLSKKWYDRNHDWIELEWVKARMIRPGFVVVDCGAHIGLTSCLFAKWTGASGQVVAFEANPRNYACLLDNIRSNRLDTIVAENLAVSDGEGVVLIRGRSNSCVVAGDGGNANAVGVASTSLDVYFRERRPPDFLKIDVEGHEEHVLLGAKDIIGTRSNLDLEIHSVLFPPQEREEAVVRILALVRPQDFPSHIQLDVDGAIVPYDANIHTARLIGSKEVVHLFVAGRTGDRA
jgi:FkbM family methyltransferase